MHVLYIVSEKGAVLKKCPLGGREKKKARLINLRPKADLLALVRVKRTYMPYGQEPPVATLICP